MAQIPSPIQKLVLPEFQDHQLEVWVKRDDLIHPHVSGNKYRKLKYNIQAAKEHGKKGLLTFGGAYSNHIAATAAAANEHSLQSIGIIRGDELNPDSNPTLRLASHNGMEMRFVTRTKFRELKADPSSLIDEFPDHYLLPEGGTNHLAIDGCAEILNEINFEPDYIITALGTGGTMAGLVKGMRGNGHTIGVSSLKGSFVHKDFQELLDQNTIDNRNFTLLDKYHFGGYGKLDQSLVDFIKDFSKLSSITLDPIYTGKMFYAFMDLMHQGFFITNSKIVLLHTGGLQGIAGFNEKQGRKVFDSPKIYNF